MLAALLTNPFHEFSLLFVLVSVLSLIGHKLKQPLIVSLILTGVLAAYLGLDKAMDKIEFFSGLGITILLFLIGLKLDLKLIRTLGKVAVATGLGQIFFTTIFGFGISLLLGIPAQTSIFIAVALTFSSTIIIVKLLTDKKEIDSLHGRIAVGFLIVQDLFVVLAMMTISTLGLSLRQEGPSLTGMELTGAIIAILSLVGFFITFLAPRLYSLIGKTPELMLTISVTLALAMASLTEAIGFGRELGGLLAGMMLASTPLRDSLSSRLASLRDFLLIFFFLHMGLGLDLSAFSENALVSILLSIFVLVGNPLIVMLIMRKLGYKKRTGFLAGLTVAQISEFSLIFMAMGMDLGFVEKRDLSIVTAVGLITITLSTYLITFSHEVYNYLEKWLRIFDPPHDQEESNKITPPPVQYQAIVLGLGRYGGRIVEALKHKGIRVLGVDFDPEIIEQWQARQIDACYYDVNDPDFFEALPAYAAKWIIHTIHQPHQGLQDDPRVAFIKIIRSQRPKINIAVTVSSEEEHQLVKELGPDYILNPFRADAKEFVEANW